MRAWAMSSRAWNLRSKSTSDDGKPAGVEEVKEQPNRSSVEIPKKSESLQSVVKFGSRFPLSHIPTVACDTPILSANLYWDNPAISRCFFNSTLNTVPLPFFSELFLYAGEMPSRAHKSIC